MRIRLGNTLYEADKYLHASIRDVRELARITSGHDGSLVTVKTISKMFTRVGQMMDDAGEDFSFGDLYEDNIFLDNIQGLAFLLRRQAGEQVSWDEAGDITVPTLFDFEDEDVPDPKESAPLGGDETPQ